MSDYFLEVNNLKKYFTLNNDIISRMSGKSRTLKAVDDISFFVKQGETLGLVGESGCGKSTLLYLLGLLDQPDGGEISIDGQLMSNSDDVARTAARGLHIGFVFQFHFLMLEFSALDNVMMPMRKLGKLSPAEMTERAHALLSSVGLGEKTHRLGTQLSGGEQQRVAIARALANQPTIILADEPTGNLDERATRGVFQLLKEINASGTAVLMATHNLDLVRRSDFRTIEVNRGQIVYDSAEADSGRRKVEGLA